MPELDPGTPQFTPPLLTRWLSAERKYMEASWFGRPSHLLVRQNDRATVLLTAPHAGSQYRSGRGTKPADPGTGSLAEIMAETCGTAALTVMGSQVGDPNWDEEVGEFKQEVERLLANKPFVIDLHAMTAWHGVDICIGLGANPDPITRACAARWRDAARALGFKVTINDPFHASRPSTITSFVQSHGVRALQFELGPRIRDTETYPRLCARFLDWFQTVIGEASRISGSVSETDQDLAG
jgi:hypothetical protein